MTDAELSRLRDAARAARERAYVPYSGFAVGAALLADDGRLFSGCNVENASFGLTCCAERTAIFTAAAAGARRFLAILVVADTPDPVRPCGACRQVMMEFGGDWDVLMENLSGRRHALKVADLLPFSFGAAAEVATRPGRGVASVDPEGRA